MKRALITGITGQDGAYLADLLLTKGYEIHGIRRRSSVSNLERIEHLHRNIHDRNANVHLHYGDLTDSTNILRIINEVRPHEIYNLAAQSDVKISFDKPEYTADVNGIGTLRLLEAIRILDLTKETKFYQASTSELFGNTIESPQSEKTPLCPRSPYSIAKLYAYWTTSIYREAYGIFACNGILFNHESPLRQENFVSRKISLSVARIKKGLQKTIYLGNLDANRDWGFAGDYVEVMWLMLQQAKPSDYVIGTGETKTVREFVEKAFKVAGINILWKGKGIDTIGIDAQTGAEVVKIDPYYFRPTEVDLLLANPSKAVRELDWKPKVTFDELVEMMVLADLKRFE